MRPRITVVTAILNQAHKLGVTIQSVLGQNCDNLDYIIIDGGSTDGTVDIVQAYADRLKCWLSEPDKGVYDAMNKGWALADPDSCVLFLGAGDRLLRLPEEILTHADPPEVIYGNVLLDGGRTFHAHSGLRLRLYNSLHHQALLIPKRLHPEPPFNLSYPLYADFDFNQRLRLKGTTFRFDAGLSAYAAPDGMTRELCLDELIGIIHKNYGQLWSGLSVLGFSLVRVLPVLGRLRPIR